MKKYLVLLFSLILCGCGGGATQTTKAQSQTTPIAGKWNVTIADSTTAPSGFTFSSQSITAGSIALNTCVTDFNNIISPNTLQLSLQSCALATDLTPGSQPNWIRTLILGTTTAQLFSGETVTYALVVQGNAGAESAILSGTGTFVNNQISGTLNCVSLNGGSCGGWATTFTASVQ